MRLNAPAGHEYGGTLLRLEPRQRFHGHEPALVGIPARHLEQSRPPVETPPQGISLRGVDLPQVCLRNSVWDNHGIDTIAPQQVLHVAADGRDRCGGW